MCCNLEPERDQASRGEALYRGTSLIRKRRPPEDPPRTLGRGLLKSPRGVRFLVSEEPMHRMSIEAWPVYDPHARTLGMGLR